MRQGFISRCKNRQDLSGIELAGDVFLEGDEGRGENGEKKMRTWGQIWGQCGMALRSDFLISSERFLGKSEVQSAYLVH